MVVINILYGLANVDDDDRHRAMDAAYAVLKAAGTTDKEAYAEFVHQWRWLETDEAIKTGKCQDYDELTGLAAVWGEAERAADIALTEGWADPDGASCGISA